VLRIAVSQGRQDQHGLRASSWAEWTS
jgi:hypothetical protein